MSITGEHTARAAESTVRPAELLARHAVTSAAASVAS